MNIRELTPEQRSKLECINAVSFRLAVVSDDPLDPQPVKGFYRCNSRSPWRADVWNKDGGYFRSFENYGGPLSLRLPAVPVIVRGPVFLRINAPAAKYPTASSRSTSYVRSSDHPPVPQAFIKIVNFDEINVGDGLTPGTEPEYKLVRVVK